MWGYCAEMCLKAAYFSLTLSDTDPIAWTSHLSQRSITGDIPT